jgi:GDP-L-fucose synthase
MEHSNACIFVAGHRGMVGSAIVRLLKSRGYSNIVTRTHEELDLTDQAQVRDFFSNEKIEQIYLAAARVGGIHANNSYPANFIYENMMIQANIIHEACRHDISKLLFLGSSCIYPRLAAQPIREESLMTGQLEPTNEAYAIAKIAGIKLCESYNRQHGTDYRCVMPTNLYGPGDNYHPENSHVIPGLIRRFHEAKMANAGKVVIWGSGMPKREFLHVDDMALASLHVMDLDRAHYEAVTQPMQSHLNVGSGEELSIGELAETVMQVVGFQGRLEFDNSKPDGTPRKLLDVSRLASLGWAPEISLKAGLAETYQAYLAGMLVTPLAGSV